MIDLSHRVVAHMPVYPGDPEVRISSALTVAADGVAVLSVACGSHTGTHVDAPAHTVPGGRTMDDVRLDELVGDALVLDPAATVQLAEREPLTCERLRLERFDALPRIVLVRTGWDRLFGEPGYLQHPFLTRDAAAEMWRLGMRVLGVDTPSPDRTPLAGEQVDLAVHSVVLGGDGLIVENLRGLDALPERPRVGFFPLRLGGADGAPVRAVAF